jgi:hypothetical protein
MVQTNRGYVIATVGSAFWSSSTILISHLVNNRRMAPLQLALWRDPSVCVGMTPLPVLAGGRVK